MPKNDPWEPTKFDRADMGKSLLEQLHRHEGQWVAVRVEGSGWEVVNPRSQEAIVAACETIAPAADDAETAERVARAINPTAWAARDEDALRRDYFERELSTAWSGTTFEQWRDRFVGHSLYAARAAIRALGSRP